MTAPVMGQMTGTPAEVYFFGVLEGDPAGSYLWSADLDKQWEYSIPTDFPVQVGWLAGVLNGGLLGNERMPRTEGEAVLVHLRGWTLLQFWDQSGSVIPGSVSTYVIRARHLSFDDAVRAARRAFPQVWRRYTFPVVCKD